VINSLVVVDEPIAQAGGSGNPFREGGIHDAEFGKAHERGVSGDIPGALGASTQLRTLHDQDADGIPSRSRWP